MNIADVYRKDKQLKDLELARAYYQRCLDLESNEMGAEELRKDQRDAAMYLQRLRQLEEMELELELEEKTRMLK